MHNALLKRRRGSAAAASEITLHLCRILVSYQLMRRSSAFVHPPCIGAQLAGGCLHARAKAAHCQAARALVLAVDHVSILQLPQQRFDLSACMPTAASGSAALPFAGTAIEPTSPNVPVARNARTRRKHVAVVADKPENAPAASLLEKQHSTMTRTPLCRILCRCSSCSAAFAAALLAAAVCSVAGAGAAAAVACACHRAERANCCLTSRSGTRSTELVQLCLLKGVAWQPLAADVTERGAGTLLSARCIHLGTCMLAR